MLLNKRASLDLISQDIIKDKWRLLKSDVNSSE